MAGLLADEEKKAAFAAGVSWRARGEKAVYGRARARAVTVLLVAIVWVKDKSRRCCQCAILCR